MATAVRTELMARLEAAAPELRARFGLSALSVFGSVARNEATSRSDVDVLVEFARPPGLFDLLRLRRHLVALTRRRVDVGTLASLRPEARRTAVAEAVRVF